MEESLVIPEFHLTLSTIISHINNPDIGTVDICSRVHHSLLPRITYLINSNGILKALIDTSLYYIPGKMYDVMSNMGFIPHEVYYHVLIGMFELMRDLYRHGIYVYPNESNILMSYLKIQDNLSWYRYVIEGGRCLWIPKIYEISFTPIDEYEYLLRQSKFYGNILRHSDIPPIIDNNEDPAKNHHSSPDYNEIAVYHMSEHPTLDKFINHLYNMFDNKYDFNRLPYKPIDTGISYGEVRWHKAERMILEMVPYSYDKDLSSNELRVEITKMINQMKDECYHLPVSALFMAINLYFRMTTLDSMGVVRCVRMLYRDIKPEYGLHIMNIMREVKGDLSSNWIYHVAVSLEHLDSVYTNIIVGNPSLYIDIDYGKWFEAIGNSGSDKDITINQFFS